MHSIIQWVPGINAVEITPSDSVRGAPSTHQPWWSGVLVCWSPDRGDTGTARHTSPRAPSQTNSCGSPAYTGTEDTEINAHYAYSATQHRKYLLHTDIIPTQARRRRMLL